MTVSPTARLLVAAFIGFQFGLFLTLKLGASPRISTSGHRLVQHN